jgi:hypothetical protein
LFVTYTFNETKITQSLILAPLIAFITKTTAMARIVELSQVPGNPYGEYYTEEDNMDIRRLITEHQTAVDVLDAELERLSRINAELLRKRSKHFNLIQTGKFALSPHSKLPLEI